MQQVGEDTGRGGGRQVGPVVENKRSKPLGGPEGSFTPGDERRGRLRYI